MSQKIALLTLSVLAIADVSARTFVTLGGETAAAGAAAHGVAVTMALDGQIFPVDVIGTSIVTAGADIEAGDELQVGADGRAVPRTTGVLVAIAVSDAAAGAATEVLLVQSAAAPAGGA